MLYDDDALYVGVWADDPEPQKIRALLTRRDVDALADVIAVGIDSYHDRRTAYVFQLNAAGVQRDSWSSTTSARTTRGTRCGRATSRSAMHGWTAEFRIPFNQLRFSNGDKQEWGFQVVRMVARNQEQSAWSPWPRASNAIVSKFGIVDGIDT